MCNSVAADPTQKAKRSCPVVQVYVTVTDTSGVTLGKMVRTTNPTSTGGDSGGGWSYDNEVFGVHEGASSTYAYFTPIVWAEISLDVEIMTQ
jgi:hypothetical protein